ncbi:hypothetical protein ACJ41O_003210 [Fusarium nematophilum]
MARTRKNAHRRRRDDMRKRNLELLRGLCGDADRQAAQSSSTDSDPAPPYTTTTYGNDNTKASETKRPSKEEREAFQKLKPRCRHRRLPARDYYAHHEKLDYRYLAFQRRICNLIDGKIAEGSNIVDQWNRDGEKKRYRWQRKIEGQLDILRRDFNAASRRLDSLQRTVDTLLERVDELEEESAKRGGRKRKRVDDDDLHDAEFDRREADWAERRRKRLEIMDKIKKSREESWAPE